MIFKSPNSDSELSASEFFSCPCAGIGEDEGFVAIAVVEGEGGRTGAEIFTGACAGTFTGAGAGDAAGAGEAYLLPPKIASIGLTQTDKL